MSRYNIFFFLLLFTSFIMTAQSIEKLDGNFITVDSLTTHIQQLTEKAKVAGFAVAIINDNQVVYQKTFGCKNAETGELLDTNTIFYGASFSKVVFSYVIMRLVEEKKLNLDKPLVQYLDKPLYEYTFPKKRQDYQDLKDDPRHTKITARMCLSHTTGFPNWRWFEADGKLKIKFEPGTKYNYSGEGIHLLQFVIEKITKKDYQLLANEFVFKPLNMPMSSYVWEARFENNYCLGHNAEGKPYEKEKRTRPGAAGSMETTLSDYARFMTAVLNKKGLKKASFKALFSPQIRIHSKQQFGPNTQVTTDENDDIQLSYGLGWGLLQTPHGKAFFKEGHDDGWGHYSIAFPEKKIAIILMSNSDNGEGIFKEVLEVAISNIYTPWYWENYIPFNEK